MIKSIININKSGHHRQLSYQLYCKLNLNNNDINKDNDMKDNINKKVKIINTNINANQNVNKENNIYAIQY